MASIGAVSENLNSCSSNLTSFAAEWTAAGAQMTDGNLTQYGYSTHAMIKSIDPIIFSCFFTLFEYSDALQIYVETLTHPDRVVYNVAHNLGIIYDLVEEGLGRFN